VAVLGKNIWGAWPIIIWEATTAKRNYYIEAISGVLPKFRWVYAKNVAPRSER